MRLFESGAIVLHIGERSEALLPKDPDARARATQWLIAALNSIEPFALNVALIDLFYTNEDWAKLRRPGAVEFRKRLVPTPCAHDLISWRDCSSDAAAARRSAS
jgi:glutathione S-transferase